ncbi:MAG TPA: DMT family transporter [Negativicutes bacterium]|nr:DMT family transporter [Negativicutes bacterium]
MKGCNGFAITAALLWGINYPLVKAVLQIVPESTFLAIRFSLASVLFLAYLLLSGESLRVRREHFAPILLLGLLGVGLYNIVWTYGIHKTTSANAALLISASPIFTGVYSLMTGAEKMRPKKWLGTLTAFAGICVIVSWTPGARFSLASELFIGNALMVVGSLLFSFYAVLAKPLLQYYSPAKLTTLAMLAGTPVILAYAALQGVNMAVSYSAAIWLGLLYIVVLGTIVAFIFWYKGVQQTSPFQTVVFHFIVPVMSMIMGAFFLAEAVNGAMLLGAILVFIGLATVS